MAIKCLKYGYFIKNRLRLKLDIVFDLLVRITKRTESLISVS